jgi:uncharacterized membrane protein
METEETAKEHSKNSLGSAARVVGTTAGGAVVGSVGGPVGAVIGGLVGALAGLHRNQELDKESAHKK